MTTSYRETLNSLLNPDYLAKGIMPTCETFDKELVQTVLNQDGCTGLRIYMGMDEEQGVKLILIGVDAEDRDMLPSDAELEDNGGILDNGMRCPDICPPSSSLNE